MEPHELVVSDVHIAWKQEHRIESDDNAGWGKSENETPELVRTRFSYSFPEDVSAPEEKSAVEESLGFRDEDGDFVVRRQSAVMRTHVFIVEHRILTTLQDVGLQVWNGALIMCDFIIAHRGIFQGSHCLELGAGSGLTILTLSLFASHVICTDASMDALDNCSNNIARNIDLSIECGGASTRLDERIKVRRLNWAEDCFSRGDSKFDWSLEDLELLAAVDILVAADVIYDDTMTEAFFKTVHRLFAEMPPKTLYLSLEKRLNFTLEDQDVVAPAYTKFQQCLATIKNYQGLFTYAVEQLPTDFPQHFKYNRMKQLEVWKISAAWK